MNVLIIGTGNVATVLARLILAKKEHTLIGIAGRSTSPSQEIAALKTDYILMKGEALPKADLAILAVSDMALATLSPTLFENHSMVVHTCGAVSKDILKQYISDYGVLYPLQSLRKELVKIPTIPFLVDGNTNENTTALQNFCKSLDCNCEVATDEDRLAMHTAAVVVSNFTNHLYALTETFCKNKNIDFKMLLPLIAETATRLEVAAPAALQTGPAVRKDLVTIQRHLAVLDDHPRLREIYKLLSESILGK